MCKYYASLHTHAPVMEAVQLGPNGATEPSATARARLEHCRRAEAHRSARSVPLTWCSQLAVTMAATGAVRCWQDSLIWSS